jgi:GH24 family phage-related lysozyme (muramidase)
LIAFAFNIGRFNFEKSKLLERLNQGEDPNSVMEKEMLKWNKVTELDSNGSKRKVINKELE